MSKNSRSAEACVIRLLGGIVERLAEAEDPSDLPRLIVPRGLRVGERDTIAFDLSKTTLATGCGTAGGEPELFNYLAPDYADGSFKGDEQSVIFSFGVSAFHALTGRWPYPGLLDCVDARDVFHNPVSTYLNRWIRNPLPPVDDQQEDLRSHPHTARCLARCLHPDRGERYRTFKEMKPDFSEALDEWIPRKEVPPEPVQAEQAPPPVVRAPPPVPVRPEGNRRSKKGLWIGLAVAAVAGIIVLGVVFLPKGEPAHAGPSLAQDLATKTAGSENAGVDPSESMIPADAPEPQLVQPAPVLPLAEAFREFAVSDQPADWEKVFDALGEIVAASSGDIHAAGLTAAWVTNLGNLAKAMESVIGKQDPLDTRAGRLERIAALLGRPDAQQVLGSYYLRLNKALESQSSKFILRVVNPLKEPISIASPLLARDLKVPPTKIKRFTLTIGEKGGPILFSFRGARGSEILRREIVLQGGGAANVALEEPVEERVLVLPPVPAQEQEGPPILTHMRDPETGAWIAVTGEHEAQRKEAMFRFSRADYLPVMAAIDLSETDSPYRLELPKDLEWKPGPRLHKLRLAEVAWREKNSKHLAGLLSPQPENPFEWKPHEDRFRAMRAEWQTRLRNLRMRQPVPVSIRLVEMPGYEAPVSSFIRKRGTTEWRPLEGTRALQPAVYELRYVRPDYEPVMRLAQVKPAVEGIELIGPAANEWKPKPALEKLLRIEAAWAEGDQETVEELFATPGLETFKWEAHANRLSKIRNEWFRGVIYR